MRFPWTRPDRASDPSLSGPSTVVPAVLPQELQTELDSRTPPYIVDVRGPGEYARGHIPGAHSVPLGSLPHRLGELPKDQSVTLVCLSGHRSHRAAQLLIRSGFSDARHMAGGMLHWKGPTQRGQDDH